MLDALLNAIAAAYDWFVAAVFLPTMTVVGERPWISGLALLAVLTVIVVDTIREEREDEDALTEAEWAARR